MLTLHSSLQFVLALVVAGIYGNDMNNQLKNNQPANPAFTFTVVVAGLCCVSALAFNIPKIKAYYAFPWDWLMAVFWLAIFGKWAQVFLSRDPNNSKDDYDSTNTQQMKNMIWIDLINLSLWFMTALYGTLVFFRRRRQIKTDYLDGGAGPMSEVA